MALEFPNTAFGLLQPLLHLLPLQRQFAALPLQVIILLANAREIVALSRLRYHLALQLSCQP